MANITITLTVDVKRLLKKARPSRYEVVGACELSDGLGRGVPVGRGCLLNIFPFLDFFLVAPVKNFTTFVLPGDTVEWAGDSNDSKYDIEIDSIVYRYASNSVNYFDDFVLQGSGGPGAIRASGNITISLNPRHYAYIINFRVVQKDGNDQWEFQIDPRLKMRATRIVDIKEHKRPIHDGSTKIDH